MLIYLLFSAMLWIEVKFDYLVALSWYAIKKFQNMWQYKRKRRLDETTFYYNELNVRFEFQHFYFVFCVMTMNDPNRLLSFTRKTRNFMNFPCCFVQNIQRNAEYTYLYPTKRGNSKLNRNIFQLNPRKKNSQPQQRLRTMLVYLFFCFCKS